MNAGTENKPIGNEERRAAATMRTTLSGQLFSAALAVIGAQAAIATFTMDKKEDLGFFYGIVITSVICLFASIVCGGKGITAVWADGFNGKWDVASGRAFFRWQANLGLVGVFLVLASVGAGKKKSPESALERDFADTQRAVVSLREDLAAIKGRQELLEKHPFTVVRVAPSKGRRGGKKSE